MLQLGVTYQRLVGGGLLLNTLHTGQPLGTQNELAPNVIRVQIGNPSLRVGLLGGRDDSLVLVTFGVRASCLGGSMLQEPGEPSDCCLLASSLVAMLHSKILVKERKVKNH